MASLRPARIIRSHRRTISLEITPDAALVVRAPLRASEAWILKLVEEKRAWIEKKMAETQNRPSPGERRFVPGEQFLFLGNSCTLEVLEGSDAGIMLGDRLYIGDRRLPESRALLVAWYAQKAAEILTARFRHCRHSRLRAKKDPDLGCPAALGLMQYDRDPLIFLASCPCPTRGDRLRDRP